MSHQSRSSCCGKYARVHVRGHLCLSVVAASGAILALFGAGWRCAYPGAASDLRNVTGTVVGTSWAVSLESSGQDASEWLMLSADCGVPGGRVERGSVNGPPAPLPPGTTRRDGSSAVCPGDLVSGVACADLNGDELLDIAIVHTTQQRVDIQLGVGDNSFSEAVSYPCVFPTAIALADLDADGFADAAVASTMECALVLMRNEGAGTLEAWAEIALPGYPGRVTIIEVLDDGPVPEMLIADTAGQPAWLAVYEMGWVVYDVAVFEDRGIHGWSECGSEPTCSTTPSGPGIQACMKAAHCRADKCDWAACTQHEQGEATWLETAWAHLACAAVEEAEFTGCLAAGLPIGGGD